MQKYSETLHIAPLLPQFRNSKISELWQDSNDIQKSLAFSLFMNHFFFPVIKNCFKAVLKVQTSLDESTS